MTPRQDYIRRLRILGNLCSGMTEEGAIQAATGAGRRVQVVNRDGKPVLSTDDCWFSRLNFTVVEGVVTAVRMG